MCFQRFRGEKPVDKRLRILKEDLLFMIQQTRNYIAFRKSRLIKRRNRRTNLKQNRHFSSSNTNTLDDKIPFFQYIKINTKLSIQIIKLTVFNNFRANLCNLKALKGDSSNKGTGKEMTEPK